MIPAKKLILILAICILIIGGCAIRYLDKSSLSLEKADEYTHRALYKSVDYDYHNLPMLQEKLRQPPNQIGSQYVSVLSRESKLLRAYYITVATNDEKADLFKPATTMAKSIGAGILLGVYFCAEGLRGANDPKIVLPLLAGSVVVGGAGGLAYGLAVGSSEAVQETGKFVVKGKEVITAYADFDYDQQDRMTTIKFYSPLNNTEPLNKIVYKYKKDEEKPYKALSVVMPGNVATELKMK